VIGVVPCADTGVPHLFIVGLPVLTHLARAFDAANATLDEMDDKAATDLLEVLETPTSSAPDTSGESSTRTRSIRTSYDELPDLPVGADDLDIRDDDGGGEMGVDDSFARSANRDRPITPERLEKMLVASA
jgi:hypothetical protein